MSVVGGSTAAAENSIHNHRIWLIFVYFNAKISPKLYNYYNDSDTGHLAVDASWLDLIE